MRAAFHIATFLAVLIIAGGCTGSHGVEPVHNLDSQSSAVAGQAVVADAHSAARGFHIAGDAGFAAPCFTVLPSTPTDADADGLPDSPGAAITYSNCTEGASTYSGSGFVIDGNSAAATFDFTNAVNLQVAVSASSETYSFQSAQSGSEGAGTFTLSDSAEVNGNKTAGSFVGSWHDQHSWSTVFTPDSGNWTPAPASTLSNGALSISGAWQLDLHPSSGSNVSVGGASSGTFRVDASCPSAIVSGSAQIILTNGQILDVTWTGCGMTETQLTSL